MGRRVRQVLMWVYNRELPEMRSSLWRQGKKMREQDLEMMPALRRPPLSGVTLFAWLELGKQRFRVLDSKALFFFTSVVINFI